MDLEVYWTTVFEPMLSDGRSKIRSDWRRIARGIGVHHMLRRVEQENAPVREGCHVPISVETRQRLTRSSASHFAAQCK